MSRFDTRYPGKNKFGEPRSYARHGHRDYASPQSLIWERAAREFQEELDDALRAYSAGLIPKGEYQTIRLRLRDAIEGARERAESFRRSGIARSTPRRGRRF
jgi:hypothetical protein